MKKLVTIGFSILLLCSLLLVGTTKAGNEEYQTTEHWGAVEVTVDGEWTSTDEWTDGEPENLSDGGRFVYKMWYSTMTSEWLAEFFDDTTDDAGDIWQICLDDQNGGGTAPQTGDYMIEITGHTTMKAYEGNGAGWTEITDASEVEWDDSITATPWNSTPHWVLEVSDIKTAGSIQIPSAPPTGMRVAAYDADTETWVSWAPDSSEDVPDEWGIVWDYDSNPYIPEAFTIGVVVLLSSVAVAVGFYFARKRPKTPKLQFS
jgi:hypothetical protein